MPFVNSKKVLISSLTLLLGLTLNISTSLPTSAAPDYTSSYLPEITSFKTTVATVSRTEKAFGKDFTFESKEFIFDLTVKVHRNTLSGLSIIMRGPAKPSSTLTTPCETFEGSIFSGAMRFGSDYESAWNWPQLVGLQSREQVGDFYIERYQIKGDMDATFAEDRNEGMGFCEGAYTLSQIDVWDMAKRKISLYLPGSSAAQSYCQSAAITCENGVVLTDFWKKNNLNTNPCLVVRSDSFSNDVVYRNCFKGEWKSFNFTISKSNAPTVGKLEVFDYKLLYDSAVKDKSALQAQVTNLTLDKTALQGQVTSLSTDKNALQNQVNTLTSDRNAIQNQLAALVSQKKSAEDQLSAASEQLASTKRTVTTLNGQLKKICGVKPKPRGC
jgi:FtsZ-binding cell division protein ZapB